MTSACAFRHPTARCNRISAMLDMVRCSRCASCSSSAFKDSVSLTFRTAERVCCVPLWGPCWPFVSSPALEGYGYSAPPHWRWLSGSANSAEGPTGNCRAFSYQRSIKDSLRSDVVGSALLKRCTVNPYDAYRSPK
jgi:hypothetical protein